MKQTHSNPAPCTPAPTKTTASPCETNQPTYLCVDMENSVKYLEYDGRARYGASFSIDPNDHAVIFSLLAYFLGLKEEAARVNIDLDKGVLLSGPVGCGKTRLMELMNLAAPDPRKFTMKSCRDVSFDFIDEGYAVITRHRKMAYEPDGPQTYCFDDLGTEQSLKYYGNACNVMGEILLSRYDHFFTTGMITHITTNLSASEIEAAYGNRVRSRMREVFNLVSFENGARDKRR